MYVDRPIVVLHELTEALMEWVWKGLNQWVVLAKGQKMDGKESIAELTMATEGNGANILEIKQEKNAD